MKITDITTTLLPRSRVSADSGRDDAAAALRRRPTVRRCLSTFIPTLASQGLGFGSAARRCGRSSRRISRTCSIGEDPFDIEKHWEAMFWQVRGYGRKGIAFCAISAIDVALWDLKAKALGLPLYQLLGPYRDGVPVYGSGGWTNFSEEELVREQIGYVERGMRSVKMKVGKDFGKAEREDVRRLAAVRKAIGDDVEVLIDANNGYYAKQAIAMAREFEQYRVGWFEEPVLADDIDGLAAVARATTDSRRDRRARVHQVWLQGSDCPGRRRRRSSRTSVGSAASPSG